MGTSQSPSPPHQYPQAIQIKLYQAFIFSIPILFSIILFLLFYLFYLKRRAAAFSSGFSATSSVLPRTSNDASTPGFKGEPRNELRTVLFDERLKSRDSMCCVCLGEFELEEQLLQVPTCKHIFHTACIRHWLHSHSTCPLCRVSIVLVDRSTSKLHYDYYHVHSEDNDNAEPEPPPNHLLIRMHHQHQQQEPEPEQAGLPSFSRSTQM